MGTAVSKAPRERIRRKRRNEKGRNVSVSLSPETYSGLRAMAQRRESLVKHLPPPVLIYDVRSDISGTPVGWEIVMWNFQHSVPESFIKLAIEASAIAKQTREPAHFDFIFQDNNQSDRSGERKGPTCVCVFHAGISAQGQDRFAMYCSSSHSYLSNGETQTGLPTKPAQDADLRKVNEDLRTCREDLRLSRDDLRVNQEELRKLQAELRKCQEELSIAKAQLASTKPKTPVSPKLDRSIIGKLEADLAKYKSEAEKYKEDARQCRDDMIRNRMKSEELVREKTREYSRINDEMKEAGKAKTQFLATMSHEIRTPLSVVISTTNLLANTTLSSDQGEMVHSIRSCGEYLLVLVNNILDVSKLEASLLVLDQSEFNLKTTMEESMDIMAQDARRKRIDMVFDVAPEVPPLLIGDPFRLRQVLINLLSNATKFTAEGGSVFFAAQLVDPVDESGQCTVQISVTDTGVGIPADGHSKLFQIFTQYDASTTRKFGGTGLGLAISKRLVEMMSGNIWFDSMPGKGTSFYFTVRVKVVQPHIPAPTPFCLLGAMWYKNQEWPDIIVVAKSEFLQNVIKAKLSRPQANTSSRSDLSNIMEVIDKARKQVLMIDEELWQDTPKEKKLQIIQSSVEGVVLMGHEAKVNTSKKAKPGLNRVSFLRKPFKDAALAECVANCLGQTINEVKKTVVAVCPLAAKIKRGITLASKYPLRILVADDNKMILQVMKKSLALLGYNDVKTVENGQLAIDELQVVPYDVILMDMQMPVLDGCEAAHKIRLTHNIPCHIIALTANAFTEDRERCIKAGMCSYMSKPVRMDVLKQELKLAYRELHCEFSTCICKMAGESRQLNASQQLDN